MNTERFQKPRDGFDTLGLRARFAFKTASSIGFELGTGEYIVVIGSMQIHHPCNGHIKARIYFQLPKQYWDTKRLVDAGTQIFRELDIPQDETYEFWIDSSESGLIVGQDVDRDGNPGGIGSYGPIRSS